MDFGTVLQIASFAVQFLKIATPIVEHLAPKLQESMKGFAERMLVLSEKYPSLEEFSKVINEAANIMGDVLFALGIDADSAGIMGAKVNKAEKGVQDFNSVEEYIHYLKNEIDMDKQEFDSLSQEEKMAYTVTGMAVGAEAIKEKLSVDLPVELVEMLGIIADAGLVVFDSKELVSLMTNLSDGLSSFDDLCDYFMGKGDSDRIKTGDIFLKALESIRPNEWNNVINEIKDLIRGKE